MKKTAIVFASACLSGALSIQAGALAAKPAEAPAPAALPPVSADPQATSAIYGDWTLRCGHIGEGAQSQKICEIVQTFTIQGQQGPFAGLSIGRPSPKDPLQITFVVVPDILLGSGVKVAVDDKDTQPVDLTWKKCELPGRCFADAEFKDDVLKRWKAQTGRGLVQFKQANGHELGVPVSFRGLAQALEGLAKS
jgi:invasion protein IalB